ncbi:PepSY-associated TM helix domain-containing protein [Rubricoccus marinus]|uniref:Peptidase n=1 Tax=Rubricoccus marinus TaxID=716817 RepID=A0A259U468_9BACT|nr:PepSY-associated TM helix domain-containing protein [Rubricoccus marinus]OZC04712.1 hypothetical protein BSZ36_11925 [Rubricoccus marinus]
MKLRPALLLWHRWFGLLAALWLTLLALTGSAIVYYDELDRLLVPEQRTVTPGGAAAPLDSVAAAATAGYPGTYARFFDLANRPDETTRVFLADRPDSATPLAHETHVFVDPYSAEVAGAREVGQVRLDRQHAMDVVYGLHVDLLMGHTAAWLLGLLGILWALDHIAGAALALPRLSKWKRSFVVKWKAGGYRRDYDLHRAVGLWLLPVTLMLALSGAYFNWYDYAEAAASTVSELTPRYPYTLPDLDAPLYDAPVPLDQIVAAAAAEGNGRGVDMIGYMPAKGVYEARVFSVDDIDSHGRQLVTVSAQTGAVLDSRHQSEGTAADAVFAWQYPLHSGKAFGGIGRFIVFVSGIAVVALNVTGITIWWRKRRSRKPRRTRPAV